MVWHPSHSTSPGRLYRSAIRGCDQWLDGEVNPAKVWGGNPTLLRQPQTHRPLPTPRLVLSWAAELACNITFPGGGGGILAGGGSGMMVMFLIDLFVCTEYYLSRVCSISHFCLLPEQVDLICVYNNQQSTFHVCQNAQAFR